MPTATAKPDPGLRIVEVGPARWADLERLFGPRGACGGCWCMWWRVERGGKTWEDAKRKGTKQALRSLVRRGRALGLIAYADRDPVGWCTFGPRRDFPRLETVRAYRRNDVEKLWSVPCFFVARGWRGKGVATGLLDAAVRAARRRGARILEGYPVTRRLPAVFSYTGAVSMFRKRGFRQVRGTRRDKPLVRLPLAASGSSPGSPTRGPRKARPRFKPGSPRVDEGRAARPPRSGRSRGRR